MTAKEIDGRDKDRKRERGRSRERKGEKKNKSRSRDPREKSPRSESQRAILVAATELPETVGATAPAKATTGPVEVDDDEVDEEEEEEEEEKESAEDVEAPGPEVKAAKAALPPSVRPTESRDKSRTARSRSPAPEKLAEAAVAPKGDQRPPEPTKAPKSADKTDEKAKWDTGGDDDKHGKVECEVCQKIVGGGTAGWWQHRRSPNHLACWVYYKQNKNNKPWSACLQDGKAWSKLLWEKNTAGPPDDTPPPVRADPEGPGGHGSSGGKQQRQSSLLLQMWQATLRELK